MVEDKSSAVDNVAVPLVASSSKLLAPPLVASSSKLLAPPQSEGQLESELSEGASSAIAVRLFCIDEQYEMR